MGGILNYIQNIVDKNDNKWKVIELSDVEIIMQEFRAKNAKIEKKMEKLKKGFEKAIDHIERFQTYDNQPKFIHPDHLKSYFLIGEHRKYYKED